MIDYLLSLTMPLAHHPLSLLLLFPIMAAALFRPATLMTLVAGIALCYALIAVGAIAANHVARTLNLADYRADD